jgi:hypothetical protein
MPKELPSLPPPNRAYQMRSGRLRITKPAIVLGLIAIFALVHYRSLTKATSYIATQQILGQAAVSTPEDAERKSPAVLVPLEAHIMSKCPDARDCLSQLLVPVMESLQTHINFTLSYIGQPTDPDDGVACKHGPTECLGNILQLCAAYMYTDPKQWLGFAMCMENRFEYIPERWFVEECAAEYGIEIEKLNECASKEDGAFGIGLLRDSVERTKAAGVTLSCTVSEPETSHPSTRLTIIRCG